MYGWLAAQLSAAPIYRVLWGGVVVRSSPSQRVDGTNDGNPLEILKLRACGDFRHMRRATIIDLIKKRLKGAGALAGRHNRRRRQGLRRHRRDEAAGPGRGARLAG